MIELTLEPFRSQADSPKGAEQQEWRYIPEHLPEIVSPRAISLVLFDV